ncbi:hypothetical protein D3C81_2012120 [compost metagenome]
MGDAGAKRAAGSALRVDMNPLVIATGLGEQVDARLVDEQPVADAQHLADGFVQGVRRVEYARHAQALWLETDSTSPVMYEL